MQKYINTVAVANGSGQLRAIAGALVTVTNIDGTAATIYDNNGGVARTDPLLTDSVGAFAFYAADGRYSITISKAGITTITIADVLLEDPADGADIMFLQTGTGAVSRPVQDVLREQHSIFDFYLASESTAEGMINRAIDAHNRAHIPAGIYSINPDVGIIVKTGTVLTGDGMNVTLLEGVSGTGASMAQLLGYQKGSLIRRRFNPSIYVSGATWTITTYTSTDGAAQTFRIYNQTATDHSAKTVTINGTDAAGAIQSEVLAMPVGSGKAYSVNKYLTVTSIVPSATIGADTMLVCLENPYVNDVQISGIGIVQNHPLASITATAIQIGFDFRNITASTIDLCHAGNIPPVGGPIDAKVASKAYLVQGFPVVFGNTGGSDPAYSGGEKNRIMRSNIYGGYTLVDLDNPLLCGPSASYGTVVTDCDIQTGHNLIAQWSQYGAGCVHNRNILQDINKQNGDVSNSHVQYYAGYNHRIAPAYIESGSNVDYQLLLTSQSNNNVVDMTMASVSSGAGAITDLGTNNDLMHFGVSGTGERLRFYNKAPLEQWLKYHVVGAATVIDSTNGYGGSVVRNSLGDFTYTYGVAMPSDGYMPNIEMTTNGSFHGGTHTIRSHSATNMRFVTYAQNAGVTTQIDPTFVWVRVSQ